jgi:hypothetical protein
VTSSPATRRTRRATRASAPPPGAGARQPVPQVAARSALAGAAVLLPPLDAAWPPEAPRRRSPVRRRLAALIAAGLVVAAVAATVAGTQVVLARLVDTAAVAGNTFGTGTWATATTWYLHNNPTPPTANTAAQFNLPLNTTAPTATTLYNYDTGCESRIGRSIRSNTGAITETGSCRYATWRSAALTTARTLNGTATLTVFARKATAGGTTPTLRAFLRVRNPSTSTYVELGQADATITTEPTLAFASYALTWSLASVSVPVGRQVEVKIVALGGSVQTDIAYDTTAYPSSLTLP